MEFYPPREKSRILANFSRLRSSSLLDTALAAIITAPVAAMTGQELLQLSKPQLIEAIPRRQAVILRQPKLIKELQAAMVQPPTARSVAGFARSGVPRPSRPRRR